MWWERRRWFKMRRGLRRALYSRTRSLCFYSKALGTKWPGCPGEIGGREEGMPIRRPRGRPGEWVLLGLGGWW